MLLLYGSHLVGAIVEKGWKQAAVLRSSLQWYDDPTGYFLVYLLGYALIWVRPLWGSFIILAASVAVMAINYDNEGFLIQGSITLLLAVLYLLPIIKLRANIQ